MEKSKSVDDNKSSKKSKKRRPSRSSSSLSPSSSRHRSDKKKHRKRHRKSRSPESRERNIRERGREDSGAGSSSSRHQTRELERNHYYEPAISSSERRDSFSGRKDNSNNFDITPVKRYFDRMFFRDTDIIRKGSVQYEDFWKFYEKIRRIQVNKKKSNIDIDKAQHSMRNVEIQNKSIQVSGVYAKIHTVPFSLKHTTVEDYICNLYPDDQDYVKKNVPHEVIKNFLQIILYFIDFLQKERFSKLKKLRETQAALPIAQFREEIVETLSKYNVLIIAGDTGCGKSTQVPQFLMKAGYINIACTQPRRIACVSLSKRVAYETLNEYGSQVGYQIRFEKRKTQHTKVVFLTEGLLLRQVSTDSMLSNYNVIVLDEVHERHLHGDFLLGIVKCLVYQREDIKVILMSATINTELFQEYFQGLAPIIQVPGRLYPIKVHYRPVSVEELTTRTGKLNPAPYVRVLQLIDDKFPQDERGDVLMFLSGVNEISAVVEAAKMYAEVTNRWIVLPLHSMLSIDDQDKAFDYAPEGTRKCICSTNIAETSITIDGIRFVVDSGKVKEMAYDTISKLQRLKEFPISKASAEQRKGRAGRTGPGVCYRIFSESEYDEFQAYSTPEIQRVPLDSLLLQMISIGIPDCRKFPFIEPPSPESLETSMARLKEQGALNDDESLTPIGKTLSNLPVDVSLGKMLIMGTLFEQVEAVLSLAAALSVQSPFTSWAHRDPDCVAARKSLDSDHGDPLTLLNAYTAWLEEKANDSSRTKKWCKRRGFEEQRFYEMTKLRQQFKVLLKDSGLIRDKAGPSVSSAERAMRHGEVKQLRSMKKDYHMAAPKKKKFLKLNEYYGQGEDFSENEADDENIDIKDVEFRLRNDSRQVKDLLHKSAAHGFEDVTMLKVILCSGLYPQFAVTDEHNQYKSDVDQLFHTKGKGFTVLHPMSVFANQPDVLAINDSDIINVAHMNTRLTISSKHQLLCYLTLLETNKPYLMNTMRMPAAQTLLLFAHSIDTDPLMTRIVFDSWLEVVFTDSASARLLLVCAMELRDWWSELLRNRLKQKDDDDYEQPVENSAEMKKSRELTFRVVKFLKGEAFYTIRRLLAADQKDLYNRYSSINIPIECDEHELRFESDWDVMHNPMKGGLSLTSFLTYGCLYGDDPDPEEWLCPICDVTLMGMPTELLCHHVECRKKKDLEELDTAEEDVIAKPFTKTYFCEECQKDLQLTPIEILKHKKTHVKTE